MLQTVPLNPNASFIKRLYVVSSTQGKTTSLLLLHNVTGKVYHQKTPSLPTSKLEQFIGIWADLTYEEEKVFEDIRQERNKHFSRPLLDIFAE